MSLGDALCDPHNIPHFLLLQFDERVEDAKVELTHVRVDVQFHLRDTVPQGYGRTYLVLEHLVLQRLVARLIAAPVEHWLVVGKILANLSHLVVVVGAREAWEKLFRQNARNVPARPTGYKLPQRGYNLARSSLESSVSNELIVMIIARRSASNCTQSV